jgi:hypothetical protein
MSHCQAMIRCSVMASAYLFAHESLAVYPLIGLMADERKLPKKTGRWGEGPSALVARHFRSTNAASGVSRESKAWGPGTIMCI